MISMIWAMDENWLVGDFDRLPWHLPKDLKYFKAITKDKTVLMGDLTYKSMKGYYINKPLPFSKIYVANLEDVTYLDAERVCDVKEFLSSIKSDIFIIGGPTIYSLSMKYADYLYITYVLDRYKGNRYFEKFDLSKYNLISYKTEEKLIFAKYERKKE